MIDIREFGAVGDGTTNDTQAIQQAFDKGSERREAVLVPAGTFLTGTLHLRNHLHIELAAGSRLLGSPDAGDYEFDPNPNRKEGLRIYLLWGQNLDDVVITGEGTIDGNGREFWQDVFYFDDAPDVDRYKDVDSGYEIYRILKPKDPRPCLLYMENCRNITLEKFKIVNSAVYTVWLLGCTHILIQNLTVRNMRKGPNTDILDLDCSSDIVVRHCDLDAGDDCIALKSDIYRLGCDKYCGDILVEDCTLRTPTCGIRIGYEGDGDIRNCTFRRLKFIDSRHAVNIVSITPGKLPGSGLVIEKGCAIYDMVFEDFTVRNSAQVFYVWAGDGGNTGKFGGSIRNLVFRNITAEQLWGSYFGSTTFPCISDISFQNVKITQLKPLAPQSPDYIPGNWASNELGAVLTLKGVHNFTIDSASALIAPKDTLLIQMS